MKYQIAMYHPAGECWNSYKDEIYKIVSFDDLESAEARAIELSELHPDCSMMVITIHSSFKTQIQYPKVEPVRTTTRTLVGV